MQAFKFNFQLSNSQPFNQGYFVDFFTEAHQKLRKAIDNVHVILNKIHLSLFMASLQSFKTFNL